MATVADKVKEVLVGVEDDGQTTESTRRDFLARATQDAETGEYYMSQQDFVDAVAPAGEDYVS